MVTPCIFVAYYIIFAANFHRPLNHHATSERPVTPCDYIVYITYITGIGTHTHIFISTVWDCYLIFTFLIYYYPGTLDKGGLRIRFCLMWRPLTLHAVTILLAIFVIIFSIGCGFLRLNVVITIRLQSKAVDWGTPRICRALWWSGCRVKTIKVWLFRQKNYHVYLI